MFRNYTTDRILNRALSPTAKDYNQRRALGITRISLVHLRLLSWLAVLIESPPTNVPVPRALEWALHPLHWPPTPQRDSPLHS